jgi:hypothetical protein
MMMMMMMTREGAGALDRLRGDDPRRGGGCDAHARHVTENPQAPGGRHLECPSSGCFFLARSPSASQVSYHVRPALVIRKSTFPRSDCFEIQIDLRRLEAELSPETPIGSLASYKQRQLASR